MQNDIVADDAIAADRHGKSRIGVECRIILDLRPLTELDPFIVAAQNRAKPDARFRFKPYTADQNRGIGDIVLAVGGKFRRLSIELINRHSRLSANGGELARTKTMREAP